MDSIARIKSWFSKAIPEPTPKNKTTQLGVHFEEVAEMLDVLVTDGFDSVSEAINPKETVTAYTCNDMYRFASHLKQGDIMISFDKLNRVDLLDALCDQIVTAVGVAHMMGFDITKAIEEVNDSNFSKFNENGEPIFDENGKIQKGPYYFNPSLDKFV